MVLRRRGIGFGAAAFAVLAAFAAAATDTDKPPEPSAAELAAHARDPFSNSTPAAPSAAPVVSAPSDATAPEIVHGTGNLIGRTVPHASQATVTDEGGITLNFVNADVRDVAKAVLGDFLNVNYTLGAGVQGTITVQTSKPLARTEVMPVFEQILRMNGLAIIRTAGVYKIVTSADAPREVSAPASTEPGGGAEAGYGTQVVPLHFIAAAEMQRLLEGMQPAQAIVHADTGRNLLIVQGTQTERAAVVDEVALFDVDWLAGMSFGLFTPKYTDARGLAKELNQILGGVGGPLSGIIRLVPIERLNTVLVVSPQPRYLDQVQRWVARLDRPGVGSDRRMFVYAVQNGRATDLAGVLKRALYGSGKDDKDDADSGTSGDAGDHAPPPATTTAPAGAPSAAAPPPAHGNGSLIDDSDAAAPPPGAATITADDTNNAIVIYGTPQEYSTIQNALQQLDVAPLQVLLEAAIAEVTLTNNLKYGVQYFYQPSDKHAFVLSNSGTSDIGAVFPGFSYMFSEGTNIRIVLDTLSQVTHVTVVSSPEVMVLNNHTATLQVGDQVPVATSQAQSVIGGQSPVINTIEYRDTGVILKITPRVNQGGMVTLDVSQEVSDVSTTSTSTLDSPTITQNKINSTIAVQDNETIALGGLIKDSRNNGSSGIPYLSEIPVVGALFGTKNDTIDRTELIVLITPHVVDNLQKARAVTSELRRKLPSLQTLLEKSGH